MFVGEVLNWQDSKLVALSGSAVQAIGTAFRIPMFRSTIQ